MNAAPAIPRTAAELGLAAQFAALTGVEPERAAAFASFAATGLPTRRNEAWHYTDLRSLMPAAAPLALPPDAARIARAREMLAARPRVGDVRLSLVDGRFVPQLSDAAPAGLLVSTLAKSAPLGQSDAVVSLNDAFAVDGLSLRLEEGVKLAERIEIAHCALGGSPLAIYSRVAITLAANAEAQIVESFFGADAACQRNAATQLNLGAGAHCAHASLVEDDAAIHLESQRIDLDERAALDAFGLVAGGALARRQVFARLVGPEARIGLAGLGLLEGVRHADTTLEVVHLAPRGESREFYRHIVADQASGVFQGKVIVKPGAQKTNGAMKSQAILLSPEASMNAKPELEIFADDVVCGHGATIGALDPEQLFYLQARGLPQAEAEAMLLEAFADEAIGRVADPRLAETLIDLTRRWLAGRGKGRRS